MMLMKKNCLYEEKKSGMHNYFKEVKEILDQLEGINFSILQELDVLMILNSLPIHYNIFVKTFTNKIVLPTLEELELQLLNEKMQIKLNVDKETPNDAMVIQGGNKSSIFKASTQTSKIKCLKKTMLAKRTNKEIKPTLATKISKSPIKQTNY